MKSKPLYWEYYWSWCPDQSLASISRVENCLTNEGVEPEGQVFFHGQEAGVMAVGQPLVVLLRTGESWPRVSVLLAKKTVHSQPGQLPRAQWNVKAGVRRFHFTVHASAVVSLWWTLVNQIRVFFLCSCWVLFWHFASVWTVLPRSGWDSLGLLHREARGGETLPNQLVNLYS